MDLEGAQKLIAESPDFRLLRRPPAPAGWPLPAPNGDLRRGIFLDTETTGLDADSDEVIELALVPFDYERESGRIVSVDLARAFAGLRQPSFPIPIEGARIHGITDAEVAGKVIDPAAVEAAIGDAHLIVAHNAGFDRPMVEKHWPAFEAKHWACTLVDIDWKSEGLSTAKLDYLLMRQGWFHDEHRALADALAGVFLLTLPLPLSQTHAMSALLKSARRALRAVRAEDTAFDQRMSLKARGYRWDDGDGKRTKAWWKLTEDPAAEIEWLRAEIYRDERQIPVVSVPATRRYSARLWPE